MPLLKLSAGELVSTFETPLNEISYDEWMGGVTVKGQGAALVLGNDVVVEEINGDLLQFDTIILSFPSFADGRAYSQARILRERVGFKGEVRARGDVLYDQVSFMRRCGFDVFEVTSERAAALNAALREFSFAYQTSADAAAPIWRRRLDGASKDVIAA